jgi:hypothetical protein
MAFEALSVHVVNIFEDTRRVLQEKPQFLPVQLWRVSSRLRELVRMYDNDRLRLFTIQVSILISIAIRYATLLLRKKLFGEELRQSLLNAGLNEGEVIMILRALRKLDITTVIDCYGEIDVKGIAEELSDVLEKLDEAHRKIALPEVIKFINNSLLVILPDVQKKVDAVFKDIVENLNQNWDSLHRCIEVHILEFDKAIEKLERTQC